MCKKNTIMICGNFNVIHSGHLRIFEFAKKLRKNLIVGVYSDKLAGRNSIINEELRVKNIASIKIVNQVYLIKKNIKDFILKYKPEIIIKGREYEKLFNTEKKIVESYGGKLIFGSGEIGISSKDFIKNEFEKLIFKNLKFPENYIARHKINFEKIKDIICNFKKIKTLVVGDIIIDKYIILESINMSREDQTIVNKKIDQKNFLGGAAITAAHCSSLGSKTTFLSISEESENKNFILSQLKKFKVKTLFVDDNLNKRIVIKEKYRTLDKSLLRINYFEDLLLNEKLKKKVIKNLKKQIKKNDIIVISDFNYGLLSKEITNLILLESRKNKKKVFLDCQSSSQFGDLKKYKDIELVAPTEYEARENLRDYNSGLVVIAKKIQKLIKSKYVLLTLGKEGLLIQNKKNSKSFETDKIDSINKSAKGVSGAGDSMFISASLALSVGANIWEASFIGSIASSIQVSRIGNIPIEKKEIFEILGINE